MIATMRDVMVYTLADFERLPEDGLFEVVDGRALAMPANDAWHQEVSLALTNAFLARLRASRNGYVFQTVNVFIPRPAGALGAVQNRIPDIAVSRHRIETRFEAGDPPELVVEVLSTRRGNVERSEKLDDYGFAGIGEYWIVNPFDRLVEVYLLKNGDYEMQSRDQREPLKPRAFPGVEIDPLEIWASLA